MVLLLDLVSRLENDPTATSSVESAAITCSCFTAEERRDAGDNDSASASGGVGTRSSEGNSEVVGTRVSGKGLAVKSSEEGNSINVGDRGSKGDMEVSASPDCAASVCSNCPCLPPEKCNIFLNHPLTL